MRFFFLFKDYPKKGSLPLATIVVYHHQRSKKGGRRREKNKKRVAVTTLCPFSEEVKEGIYKTLNNPGDGLTIMSENQTVQKCACSESFCGYKFQVVYLLLLRCSSEQVSFEEKATPFCKSNSCNGLWFSFAVLSLFEKQQ